MTAAQLFELDRFVQAQTGVYDIAMAELRAGRKQTHWMWFIFPQLRGLGHSPTARHFGIVSIGEARAYLAHGLLGPRLESATQAVLAGPGQSLTAIFGSPDDLKFRSSMTLFAAASPDAAEFCEAALKRFCAGERDGATLALLRGNGVATRAEG